MTKFHLLWISRFHRSTIVYHSTICHSRIKQNTKGSHNLINKDNSGAKKLVVKRHKLFQMEGHRFEASVVKKEKDYARSSLFFGGAHYSCKNQAHFVKILDTLFF